MIGAITSALSGLTTATRQVEQSAQNIAEGSAQGASGTGLIEDIVDIKVAETSYRANLAVLRTTDELTQELLNTFDETV